MSLGRPLLLMGMLGGAGGRAVAAPQTVAVEVDGDAELRLVPPSPLPLLGPRFAPVTVDLFLPFGMRFSDGAFRLALHLVRESLASGSDLRLQWRPTLGSAAAERGAEVAWEACQQQPDRCFGFLEQLYLHPDWLRPGREAEDQLVAAAQRQGLDTARFALALTQRPHRARIAALWQTQREVVRLPPEVWVNGRRLRSSMMELQLATEIDRALLRAQKALREGVRVSELYDLLLAEERSSRSDSFPYSRLSSPPPPAPLGPGGLRSPWPRPAALAESERHRPSSLRLDLSGTPRRGPAIAAVTVTLIGSIDSYATFSLAKAATDVWAHHQDRVRLCYLHAPRSESSRRFAELLAQVGLLDEPRFWRSFDALIELLPRRFALRQRDLEDVLRRQGDLGRFEAALTSGRAAAVVQRDLDQVRRIGVEYAPLILVNGRPVRGTNQAEALERAVTEELGSGLLSRLRRPPSREDFGWLTR